MAHDHHDHEERTPADHPRDHHWEDPECVRAYVDRMDQQHGDRSDLFKLMLRLTPWPADKDIRILDLGAGYGPVTKAALEWFPNGTVVCLDSSEPMRQLAMERLGSDWDRVTYVMWDFAEGELPDEVEGQFHVILSSLAIHHLLPDAKQRFYRVLNRRLYPGGCFVNIDVIGAPSERLSTIYQTIRDQEQEERYPGVQALGTHRRGDHPDKLLDQLKWLEAAGFVSVDCFWKRLGLAMYGGYRSERSLHTQ